MEYNQKILDEWECIGEKKIYNNGNPFTNKVYKRQQSYYENINVLNIYNKDKCLEINDIYGIQLNSKIFNGKKYVGKVIKILDNKIFLDEIESFLDNDLVIEKKYTEFCLDKDISNIVFPQNDLNNIFIKIENKKNDTKFLDESRLNSINSENIITIVITTCIGFVFGNYIFNKHLK